MQDGPGSGADIIGSTASIGVRVSCSCCLEVALTVLVHAQEFVTTKPGDKEPVCGRQEYSVTEDRPIEKVPTWTRFAR